MALSRVTPYPAFYPADSCYLRRVAFDPGFLTDTLGFFFLGPSARERLGQWFIGRWLREVTTGQGSGAFKIPLRAIFKRWMAQKGCSFNQAG
ncbi:MAG: hypothetical protein Ct9H300mP13_0230 [Gammaproteobacteria bacterium]|nr:MAG: hypothetical protein Ct9H300mP13_0230 [Gammaproteobacteria bacterium]